MIFTKKIINCTTSNAKVLILLDEIDSFQFVWNFLRDFRISSKAWNLESYSYIIIIMSCSEDKISVLTAQYICLLNIILFIDIRRNTLNKITAKYRANTKYYSTCILLTIRPISVKKLFFRHLTPKSQLLWNKTIAVLLGFGWGTTWHFCNKLLHGNLKK